MRKPSKQKKALNDLSRSLIPFDPNRSLIAVIELSKGSWLVAGIIPGVEREPLKKLAADENGLLKLLERWRAEGEKAGHKIDRITVAFEAGRDGFWLARWLTARGIEAHVIHASSVAVPREHRRAKTDRAAFVGRARKAGVTGDGAPVAQIARQHLLHQHVRRLNAYADHASQEQNHGVCSRLRRLLETLKTHSLELPCLFHDELPSLHVAMELTKGIGRDRLTLGRAQLFEALGGLLELWIESANAKPRQGGLHTVDDTTLLADEALMLTARPFGIFLRQGRDRRHLAVIAFPAQPAEKGAFQQLGVEPSKRREKGLSRSGNARVRRGMVQLAWRFVAFQKDSALVRWFNARTENARSSRKKMIVALARKLLVALWHFVHDDESSGISDPCACPRKIGKRPAPS